MKMSRISILIGLVALVLPAAKGLGQMNETTVAQLSQLSAIVVKGRVADLSSRWSADGRLIITRAAVDVERLIKGALFEEKILVEYPGGELDGIGLKVSNVVLPNKGEQLILFLSPDKEIDGTYVRTVVGSAQGQFLVSAEGTVSVPKKRLDLFTDDISGIDSTNSDVMEYTVAQFEAVVRNTN